MPVGARTMPAASIVLRSTSSSSLRSNADPGRSVCMSLLMRPQRPRRCAARARVRHSVTGAADGPESRGFVAHDARRPHRAPLSSSARCSPPCTPPPRTRPAWARRAGRSTARSARGSVVGEARDDAGPNALTAPECPSADLEKHARYRGTAWECSPSIPVSPGLGMAGSVGPMGSWSHGGARGLSSLLPAELH